MKPTTACYLLLIMVFLAGCSTVTSVSNNRSAPKTAESGLFAKKPQDGPGNEQLAEKSTEPVPRALPKSRYGNPKFYEVGGKTYTTMESAAGYRERGKASWYGRKFHGRLTSSREIYDMYQLTAAHRSLPIPTFVEVTHLDSGKSIVVKVNDRGPFHQDRIIDLSYAAAVKLDMIKTGTAPVEVKTIDPANLPVSVPENTSVMEDKQYGGPDPQAHAAPAVTTAVSIVAEPPRAASKAQEGKVDGVIVQLGAYSQLANARSMHKTVKSLIPAAQVRIFSSAARNLYHVQLGPLYSSALLADVIEDLKQGGVEHYQLIAH